MATAQEVSVRISDEVREVKAQWNKATDAEEERHQRKVEKISRRFSRLYSKALAKEGGMVVGKGRCLNCDAVLEPFQECNCEKSQAA